MIASTITPTRRRRASHPLPKKKSVKQSVSFIRMNANKKVIRKEEFAFEQRSREDIFRLSSRRAEETGSELIEMWKLKRASTIVSSDENDDRLGREGRHMIGTTKCNLFSLLEII